MRISNSARSLKQSNQFLSPHSILLQSKSAVQQRLKKVRTVRPNRSPSLVKVLSTYSDLGARPSPFLPTKFRSDHSNPAIDPSKVRWRGPIIKAQARAQLCKQAFHWRILKYIFNLPTDSSIDPRSRDLIPESTSKSARNLLKQKPDFYDGSLSLEEFQEIKDDPVPKLVELFGGEERLSVKDRRLLGLLRPAQNFARVVTVKPTNPTSPTTTDSARPSIHLPPRYSVPTLLPHAFGPYIGRRKPFKGKTRQRNREAKVSEITQKMVKMDDRVEAYRKEWRAVREKSKPSLPF